mgnify:CR=1 FL=1
MKPLIVLRNLFIVLFAVAVIGAVYYSNNLVRLYTAITLYDEDKIVNNFLSLYESFNANRIEPSQTPFEFPSASGTHIYLPSSSSSL